MYNHNGFFTDSTGQVPYEVHALVICRGDLTLTECTRCINSTSQYIMTECPNQKEAFMWGPSCIVRYTDRSFYGKLELDPECRTWEGAHRLLDIVVLKGVHPSLIYRGSFVPILPW